MKVQTPVADSLLRGNTNKTLLSHAGNKKRETCSKTFVIMFWMHLE